jgi:heptosyltransferase-2
MKNILVIQTAFLGDVILATAMVRNLKIAFPEANIDFLLKKENASLLLNHPDIRTVIAFDKKKKWKEMWRIIVKARKEQYDLIVNCHRFASSGIITILSGAKQTVGFDKNPLSFFYSLDIPHIIGSKGKPFHEIQRNHSLINHLVSEAPAKPYLHLDTTVESKIEAYRKHEYVCIAPSSVWFTKQTPEEKWTSLMRKIPEHVHIYLLGAAGDISLCERIKNNAKREHVKILAGKLSMLESAALMKYALINYVNDSAPTHLASAVNACVCTVYCSTVPEFGFGPVSEVAYVVEKRTALPCRPCNLHGKKNCPALHFKCGNDIDSSELYQIFEEIYTKKG